MFTLAGNLYRHVRQKREKKVTLVLLGLDNAGKTTLLHTIMGEVPDYVGPTYGFTNETFAESPFTISVYDVGGGKRIRSIWGKYLAEVHGAVFVVDAADPGRFEEAKEVLLETLSNPYLSSKPILILANKQDIPTASTVSDLAVALGLTTLKNNRYHVLPCVAKMEEGEKPDSRVKEGIKWMTAQVSTEYQQLEQRVRKDAAVEQEKAAKEREERMKRVAEQKAERARLAAEEEAREAAAAQVLLPDGHQRSHLLPPAPAAPCSSSSSSSATTRPHPEGGWQRLADEGNAPLVMGGNALQAPVSESNLELNKANDGRGMPSSGRGNLELASVDSSANGSPTSKGPAAGLPGGIQSPMAGKQQPLPPIS